MCVSNSGEEVEAGGRVISLRLNVKEGTETHLTSGNGSEMFLG